MKYHCSIMNCQLSRVLWHNIHLFQFKSASFCDDSVHNLWVITVIWNIYDIVISLVKNCTFRAENYFWLYSTIPAVRISSLQYIYIYTKWTFVTMKCKSAKVRSISLLVLLLFITYTQDIYNYVLETNYVYRLYIYIYIYIVAVIFSYISWHM